MNVVHGGRTIAIALLCCLTSISAHASTWLNIPASAAHAAEILTPSNCYFDASAVSAPTPAPEGCQVLFPVTLPAGTAIRQIWVVHGTLPLQLPNPGMGAHLRVRGNTNWNDQVEMYDVADSMSYPNGDLYSTPMLPLFGQGFVMAGNETYQVEVDLGNGAYTTGIQIIYN